MGNLYGFLGPIDARDVALITLSGDIQGVLAGIFADYEREFRKDVEDELPFDGGYSPDSNQLTVMKLTEQMAELAGQIEAGAIGRDRYDPTVRSPEEIRALAWSDEEPGRNRILIQNFTRAQTLSRRIALWFDGNTFTRLDDRALLIGNRIDAIVEGGVIRFKKFSVLKQIFDMVEVYRAATDQDIRRFSELESVRIDDVPALCAKATDTVRKLIFSVSRSGILAKRTPAEIQRRAKALKIDVDVASNKLVLPTANPALTRVLKFLDHSIYRSPLTNDRWLANSRRRL
jgi:Domain of unknown function (DUF4868)